jgi:hypothetical protein
MVEYFPLLNGCKKTSQDWSENAGGIQINGSALLLWLDDGMNAISV